MTDIEHAHADAATKRLERVANAMVEQAGILSTAIKSFASEVGVLLDEFRADTVSADIETHVKIADRLAKVRQMHEMSTAFMLEGAAESKEPETKEIEKPKEPDTRELEFQSSGGPSIARAFSAGNAEQKEGG